MTTKNAKSDWRDLLSLKAFITIWGPILLISAGHYTTSTYHHWLHDIFRRLYYIPIILGAFSFGLRGALSASIVASLIYSPHAFTNIFEQDPTSTTEKMLELLLYNIVAVITGHLAEREKTERLKQEKISQKLEESLEEMKLLEEQLIRAGRLQALGELTAGLAHEIKNPLASIKGASEIISDEIPEHSQRRKIVDIQKKELSRLETLLEKFLFFARPENFERGRLEIGAVVGDVISLFDPQARKQKVELNYRPAKEKIFILGDKEKLSQIVINLLLNALDVSPPDSSIDISIERAAKGRRNYIAIKVEDRGYGVTDEIKEKIFNPFFTTKDKGTGLGLSIASRIADEHNGFIDIQNRPDGGAVFCLYLPDNNDEPEGEEVKE